MEDIDAVQKPVVVDPPLHNEAPPPVVAGVAQPAEFHLIQRIQRALVELRELRNQFNAILREMELEGLLLSFFLCIWFLSFVYLVCSC